MCEDGGYSETQLMPLEKCSHVKYVNKMYLNATAKSNKNTYTINPYIGGPYLASLVFDFLGSHWNIGSKNSISTSFNVLGNMWCEKACVTLNSLQLFFYCLITGKYI